MLRSYCFFLLFLSAVLCRANPELTSVVLRDDSLTLVKTKEERIAYLLRKTDDYFWHSTDTALAYAYESLRLAQQLKSDAPLIRSYLALGNILQYKNSKETLVYLTKAMDLAENAGLPLLQEQIYAVLTGFYIRYAQYDKAALHAQKRTALVQKYNLSVSPGYDLIAQIDARQGNTEIAVTNYQKQIDWLLQNGHEKAVSGVWSEMGNAYFHIGNYDDALECYFKGLSVAKKFNDIRGLGYLKDNIGMCYHGQKNYRQALQWQRQSIAHRRQVNDELNLIQGYLNIFETFDGLQMTDSAFHYLQAAYRSGLTFNDFRYLRYASSVLAEIYFARGNKDSAYLFMHKARIYTDSLRREEMRQALAGAGALAETERISLEKKLLEEQNRFLIWGALIISIVLLGAVVTALFIYRQHQLRRKLIYELESANHAKNKVFAIVSHDLRGPIGTLSGMLFLLNDRSITQEKFLQLSARLQNDVSQLRYAMDQLLYWASSQLQGIKAQRKIVAAAPLAQGVTELLQPIARQKSISIINNIPSDIQVQADPAHLEIIIRNLVSNAIKFTPDNGQIELSASPDNQFYRFSIKDSGVGMSPETLASLFSLGNQPQQGTASEKGIGLGLLLCKDFLTYNGGIIWVESTPGQGSTFYFKLSAAGILEAAPAG